jgi:tRNA A37 threonylcarbamoyladenosine dehydratase
MEFRSRMTLLDQDCVDVSNLNRSPLFSVQGAVNCRRKTDVGAAWLKR